MLGFRPGGVVQLDVHAADSRCIARNRETYPNLERAAGLGLGEKRPKVLGEVSSNCAGRKRRAGSIRERKRHQAGRVSVVEPGYLYI